MKLLFVADALATFKPHKDSTFAMMREAQQRGFEVFHCTPEQLSWRSAEPVQAQVTPIALKDQAEHLFAGGGWWESLSSMVQLPLKEFAAVLMRKDPPFDSEFVYSTYILERAEQEGVLVANRPQSLRDCNEKMFATAFPDLMSPTLVTRRADLLKAFHAEQGDVIFKPLDGMGGSSIFRLKEDDPNVSVIIETLTNHGSQQIMAQKFIPAITEGDKRILMIDGEPVPYTLARIPAKGETRGNLAAGGRGETRPLSDADRKIADIVGPELKRRGLYFVGLDVIGDCLTEINVTSPTCVREISRDSGIDVAGQLIDRLLQIRSNGVDK